MAVQGEDPASVLEQFMHDAANLPAEINYMMEEIQAKDKEMQKFLATINSKDSTLQKHVKANGSMQAHSKEVEFTELVKKNYGLCAELQSQKIALSEKACVMLERQVKRLDMKIRELQSDGQLLDGPPLPSVFNRKPDVPKSFIDIPTGNLPLQAASVSALNANARRMSQHVATAARQPQPRQMSQFASSGTPAQRSSAPATPATALQQQKQQDRELSAGAEIKRRKLTAPTGTLNMPAQPSNLRQSSLGPGTPKAGTPTAGSRAGSIPRTLGQHGPVTKKSGLHKKAPSHAAVNKLKGKHNKRLSSAGRKKGQSPSIRGGRGATVASEEDSVLSSGDPSDTDASHKGSRRGNKKAQEDVEMAEDDDIDDEDAEDDRRYCTCNQRSYGEMVACENDDCPFQWFHTGCLNMKKVPDEDEDWYCPTCRLKPEIQEKMKAKQKKMKK